MDREGKGREGRAGGRQAAAGRNASLEGRERPGWRHEVFVHREKVILCNSNADFSVLISSFQPDTALKCLGQECPVLSLWKQVLSFILCLEMPRQYQR